VPTTETSCSLLVCGSRHVRSVQAIRSAVASVLRSANLRAVQVLTGDAAGVDRIAADIARSQGIPVLTFTADWARHGPAAGPIRNGEMVQEFRRYPGCKVVVALRVDGIPSRGTDDTVHKCQQHLGLWIFEILLDKSALSY
jgi:hypothetical protein